MRSNSDVEVSAWIKIGDSTEIDYDVFADGQIELSLGGHGEFELVTTEELAEPPRPPRGGSSRARSAITRNDEGRATNGLSCSCP